MSDPSSAAVPSSGPPAVAAAPGRPGVLLVNLGTPDAPHAPEVRRYLREFLGDPRVVDLNPVGRFLLLNLVILPFRPARSAEAYRKIWTPDGSPLLVHGRALAAEVARALPEAEVALAMRYGEPSLARGLAQLRAAGCGRIVVVPLYPQYASSTTGSTLEAVYGLAGAEVVTPALSVVPPFYDDPGFLDAFAERARETLAELRPEHVLFSFHGLPERHLRKADPTGGHCLGAADCCAATAPGVGAAAGCYRAQCYATARGLAERLGLGAPAGGAGPGAAADDAGAWSVAFQSRLGRVPWIRPYTDERLVALAAGGCRRLAVICPAFVADCLETVEEIGLRGAETFRAAGGERLALVASLNASPAWIAALTALIRRAL